jgi:hypothetical protein
MMPDLQPQVWEGHQTQAEFFSDKQRGESAKQSPNYLLITVINGMMQMLLQAQIQFGQLQAGAQVAVQAPMMAAQEQEQMAAEQRMVQNNTAEMQAAQESEAKEDERAQMDREHEKDIKMLDLADKQADRENKQAIAKKAGATKK